jgi:hypothetical protein
MMFTKEVEILQYKKPTTTNKPTNKQKNEV